MSTIVVHPITGEPIIVNVTQATVADAPKAGGSAAPADATVDRKGRFVAVFSTFSVIDHDSDVTLPEAFGRMEGKTVPVSAYGHTSWEGAMPIGSATIHSTLTHAEARGHLLMDTEPGRHMYAALRDHGSELSYGYVVLDSARGTFKGEPVRFLRDVEVFEVSFVLRGAGLGTGVIELDDDLRHLSPEAREAVVDFRRLEARIDHHATRRNGKGPDMARVYGFKVPPRFAPKAGTGRTSLAIEIERARALGVPIR